MYNDLLKKLNQDVKEGKVGGEVDPDAMAAVEQDNQNNAGSAVKKYMTRQSLYGKFKRAKEVSNYDSNSLSGKLIFLCSQSESCLLVQKFLANLPLRIQRLRPMLQRNLHLQNQTA